VKKLLLTSIAALFLVTGTAQAQQFIGGSGDYGRRHNYQGSSVRFTPSEAACYHANYASTLAMQRCAELPAGIGPPCHWRGRRHDQRAL